jgi:hypothetical protein
MSVRLEFTIWQVMPGNGSRTIYDLTRGEIQTVPLNMEKVTGSKEVGDSIVTMTKFGYPTAPLGTRMWELFEKVSAAPGHLRGVKAGCGSRQ